MQEWTSEKEIKCEVCFKTFKSKWLLKRHLTSWKAEKCLECPTCDEKFTILRGLQLDQEKANYYMVEDNFVATMVELPYQNFGRNNEIPNESKSIYYIYYVYIIYNIYYICLDKIVNCSL